MSLNNLPSLFSYNQSGKKRNPQVKSQIRSGHEVFVLRKPLISLMISQLRSLTYGFQFSVIFCLIIFRTFPLTFTHLLIPKPVSHPIFCLLRLPSYSSHSFTHPLLTFLPYSFTHFLFLPSVIRIHIKWFPSSHSFIDPLIYSLSLFVRNHFSLVASPHFHSPLDPSLSHPSLTLILHLGRA